MISPHKIRVYKPCEVEQAARDAVCLVNQKPHSEVDRFGFSSLLNYILAGRYRQRSAFCNWVHGWKWYPPESPEMLGVTRVAINNKYLRRKPIVVHAPSQVNILRDAGFENVVHACLPYAYLDLALPDLLGP